jgi:hypothetical protein
MNFNRLLLKTVGLTLVVFLLDGCGAQIQPTATTPLPTATSVPPTTTSSTAPAVTVLPISSPQPVGDGVVDGWAVLAEKDDYDDVISLGFRNCSSTLAGKKAASGSCGSLT